MGVGASASDNRSSNGCVVHQDAAVRGQKDAGHVCPRANDNSAAGAVHVPHNVARSNASAEANLHAAQSERMNAGSIGRGELEDETIRSGAFVELAFS